MSGKGNQSTAQQFPPSFSLYKTGWGSKHYFLGQPGAPPIYAVSLHTGWSGKPDIILHNGPTEGDPPLATSSKVTLSRAAAVTLPPSPGSPGRASEERVEVSSGGFGRPVLSFSIEVEGTGRRERFERRHSSGDEVRALGGRSSGWKLVALAADRPAGGPNSGPVSSDGKEVVAVWATEHLRLHKGFRFRFLGTGASGSLGERWATMAVISALRGWDRARKAQNSNSG